MARKKDFTKNETLDTLRTIATSDTTDTSRTHDTQDTPTEYRFNMRFTAEQGRYLTEKKWKTRKSITAIIQELVNEDMAKHPEILETIDELN